MERTGETRFKTAKEWLLAVQQAAKNGYDVTCYDDPRRRMLGFAWGHDIDEQQAIIGLADLRNTMGDLDGIVPDTEALKKSFQTPEGRMQIPSMLRGVTRADLRLSV